MGWLKPKILDIMTGGLRGKDLNTEFMCPWKADCPQHNREVRISPDIVRKVKRDVMLPSKMRLVEQVQPYVRLYQCGYCGMKSYVDVDGRSLPEEERAHLKNPALLGGKRGVSIYR